MEPTDLNQAKTVILADDEPYILAVYKEALEQAGFSVYPVRSGQEVLDTLKKFVPDLLVLDLIMPGVSGFEVIKKLKADDNLKDLPIVILTNLSQGSDEEEVRNQGVNEYIVKADSSISEFIERVNQVFAS